MKFKFLFLVLVIALASTSVFAAGTPGPPTQSIPVDGGVILLAAAAGAYGYKKMKDSKKPKSDL